MGNLAVLDYVIIVAYLVFAIVIGICFSKKASLNTESYFLGGRTLPWWMICVSMIATSFASDTPLVITEMIRSGGLQNVWWPLIQVMMLVVGIFLFSRLWRRCNITTDAEFYELRYEGKSAAFLRGLKAFVTGVVVNLIIMAWVTFAMSHIISIMTGIDATIATAILIIVALTYATLSGFYGVVVTDLFQFAIATFSMLLLAVIVVVKLGGFTNIYDTILSNPDYGLKTISLFPDFKTLNLDMVKMSIYILVLWWSDAGGANMQRMSACKSENDSVKATLFCAIFQTARPWLWIVVAFGSVALYPILPEGTTDTDAYPLMMNEYLVPGAGSAPFGETYEFVDSTGRKSDCYMLEWISFDGKVERSPEIGVGHQTGSFLTNVEEKHEDKAWQYGYAQAVAQVARETRQPKPACAHVSVARQSPLEE